MSDRVKVVTSRQVVVSMPEQYGMDLVAERIGQTIVVYIRRGEDKTQSIVLPAEDFFLWSKKVGEL